MSEEKKTIPTWLYDATTGEGAIFELAEGEKIPAGFVDSPAKSKAAKAEAAKGDKS